jgi:hypothetical protein
MGQLSRNHISAKAMTRRNEFGNLTGRQRTVAIYFTIIRLRRRDDAAKNYLTFDQVSPWQIKATHPSRRRALGDLNVATPAYVFPLSVSRRSPFH